VSSKSVQLDRFEKSGLHKFFKLVSSLPVTNMNAFDVNNRIVKFSSAEAIADSYFPVRLSLYSDRKSVLESEMNYTTTMMRNKARFIQAVADGDVDLVRQQHTKQDTLGRLMELGFDDSNTLKAVRSDNAVQSRVRDGAIAVDDEPEKSSKDEEGDFDYLLNMPLSSLTVERIQELHRDAERNESQLEVLKKTSPEDLWRSDLDQLEAHF
jgi:DNA topoisomerase-2